MASKKTKEELEQENAALKAELRAYNLKEHSEQGVVKMLQLLEQYNIQLIFDSGDYDEPARITFICDGKEIYSGYIPDTQWFYDLMKD